MSAHTPVPWTHDGWHRVQDSSGRAVIADTEEMADAAHIVRCVNAHAELVAVLQNIVAGYDSDGTFFRRDIIAARAALAKAGAA